MLDVIGVKVCYRLTVPGVCQAFIPAGTGRGETEQAVGFDRQKLLVGTDHI